MEQKLFSLSFSRLSAIALYLLVALVSCSAASAQAPGRGPALWVSSRVWTIPGNTSISDAAQMFAPNSPWKQVASRTAVVILAPGDIQNGTDAQDARAFADLKQRHIALAFTTGLLRTTPACKETGEAYYSGHDLADFITKIKRLGGDLRYVSMDEPFFYGNRWDGPNACHESAEVLAGRLKESIAIIRRSFPHVQIGDIEVLDESRPWTETLLRWTDTYRRVTGENLAFFQTDIDWSEASMRNLGPLAAGLRRRGIPLGVIFNADASVSASDTGWTNSTLQHLAEIEGPLGIHPDQQIVWTWVAVPTHALPETKNGTLTNVALRLLQPAPSLSLSRAGSGISGLLSDASGQPLVGARIALARSVGDSAHPSMRRIAGIVPPKAASVVLGVRVETEGAGNSAGRTPVAIGTLQYQENGRPAVRVNPGKFRRFWVVPNKPDMANIETVPVTARAPYLFEAPIGTAAAATHAGYVTAVFLDAAGNGLDREFLWFEPGSQPLPPATTDATGRFTVPASPASVRAYYPGTNRVRPAMAILPAAH